jgi:hypothetical protein
MGTCLESKEPTSEETEIIAMHEEVPKEEAAVKTVRALMEWYGDQHLAIGRCQRLKKWTCHAIPALCKGQGCKRSP